MSKSAESTPVAVLKPARRWSLAWIIPIAAVALAGALAWRAWSLRGVTITIQFDDGHGLRVGDDVRSRGIAVGEVREIALAPTGGVLVTAALDRDAGQLAQRGARFWIARLEVGLAGVAGLDTLIGPRYIELRPADVSTPPRRHFVGLERGPIVERIDPGDLEIVLHAPALGSLRPGAPVTYRQMRIGTVLSVGLTSDAGAVEARVHIQQPFRELIRPGTRFWDSGGIETGLGLTGITIRFDSLQSMLAGGVSLATPPGSEGVVTTGHRFELAAEPEEEWLEWQPMAAIGSSFLPPGATMPTPLRATVAWRQGLIFRREKSRSGWIIQTERDLVGPADLLRASDDARRGTAVLEVAGKTIALDEAPAASASGVARREAQVNGPVWPLSRVRRAEQPEDCLVVADPTAAPLPLAASRLTARRNGVWAIDESASLDDSWHGAAVLARSDGRLIGIVLVADGEAAVAPIPAAEN